MKNHHELYAKDLAGWKLAKIYVLVLEHGSMGFYPAIIDDDEQRMFGCLDQNLLIQVGRLLSPRQSKILEFRVLANEKDGIAFELGRINEDEFDDEKRKKMDECIELLTQERFETLIANTAEDKSPFKWTPGIIGAGMTQEEFAETLEAALRKIRGKRRAESSC